jgi:hypothetical protein
MSPPTVRRRAPQFVNGGKIWHGPLVASILGEFSMIVRHLFYDWATEIPSSLQIWRISDRVALNDDDVGLDAKLTKQLATLGDFILENLKFFVQFGGAPPANDFLEPFDFSLMGASSEM